MSAEFLRLEIVIIFTVGFTFASILGYLSFKAKLSPIFGYLLAGYIIGPFSPGYALDIKVAEQLAEIGVILMLFSVGLHFKWQDLLKRKNIAIVGAIGQTLIASLLTTLLIYTIGWSLEAGIVFGLSIGVASTVVLVRMLDDYNLLHTEEGHIAVGWLIVEDIITVMALLVLPILANFKIQGGSEWRSLSFSILSSLVSISLFAIVMLSWGRKGIRIIFSRIMATKHHELFTLTILAVTFLIATGSAWLFGTSIALGAFIGGMVIGQTDVRHQVSNNTTPLRDTFTVIFFLSVGMLFNPLALKEHPFLFLGILFIVLIIKPLTAFLITWGLKYPLKTSLTVAVALAQIGEFSFILSEEALKLNIFPDLGFDVIVACALVSISINPLLFKQLQRLKL